MVLNCTFVVGGASLTSECTLLYTTKYYSERTSYLLFDPNSVRTRPSKSNATPKQYLYSDNRGVVLAKSHASSCQHKLIH